MIRTGVIGYGLGGRAFHAPLIEAVPELALVAVATSRADEVRAAYPQVAVTSADALIADPDIALVVISTPNDTHVPLAHAAIEAGKHVVIDKPFANTPTEAEALIDLARERGVTVTPFHNRRWDSDFLTVAKLIGSGRLGEVMLYEAHWDRFSPVMSKPWKETPGPGAGQLADLGTHLIDQALVLFGPPEAVQADLAAQREGAEVEDYFAVTLFYGRRRVVLTSSRLITAPRPRFALYGREGSFVKHGLDPQEAALASGLPASDPTHGLEDGSTHGVLTLADGTVETIASERGDYRRFYRGVADAIATGAAPPVAAEDAVTGLKIVELARRSAAEGRRLAF